MHNKTNCDHFLPNVVCVCLCLIPKWIINTLPSTSRTQCLAPRAAWSTSRESSTLSGAVLYEYPFHVCRRPLSPEPSSSPELQTQRCTRSQRSHETTENHLQMLHCLTLPLFEHTHLISFSISKGSPCHSCWVCHSGWLSCRRTGDLCFQKMNDNKRFHYKLR